MPTEIKSALTRHPASLAQDFAGAAALVVMLLTALYAPGFF